WRTDAGGAVGGRTAGPTGERWAPPGHSPAVVSEGPVGLGHLVGVLATLDSGTEAVGGVQDLVHQTLGHGVLATRAGVVDQPAQRQRGGAAGLDLDRHLVGRTADAAGADLEGRPDVVQRLLQGDDRVLAVLLTGALERAVDDALGGRILAVQEELVDQLRDDRRAEDGVDDELALGSGALTRHYFFSFFAP